MAYIVNKRDGTVIATVADGTIDTTSTSLILLGKGFNNYGEIVAEDWVHLMEHFANATPPLNAIRGQMWFDTSGGRLHVNLSNVVGSPEWVSIGSAYVQGTTPDDSAGQGVDVGTFWYDTAGDRLNVSLDGSSFTPLRTVSVGTPPGSPSEGDLFYDTTTKELKVYNADLHGTASAGFDVVGPARHTGTEPTTSLNDGDEWFDSTNKQLHVYDGTAGEFRLVGPISPAGSNTGVEVGEIDGNSVIFIRVGNDIVGIWSRIDFTPSTAVTGFDDNAGGPTPLRRGLNLAPNTGPSTEQTVMQGLATESQYADLAERYATDVPTQQGDLVKLGGQEEVTLTQQAYDVDVFGVVSTEPGLRLNSTAGSDQTHPYIALAGRVPCKVVGPVKKGDRLVASDVAGVAQAITPDLASQRVLSVFGRALETNDDSGVKLVEVTIGVK